MVTGVPRLPARLKRTQTFQAVYRRGRWAHRPLLSVGALPRDTGPTRIGIRTRRGLKGAPQRNRLKRQIRGLLSARHLTLRGQLDVVIVIHPGRLPVASAALLQDLLSAARRLGALA